MLVEASSTVTVTIGVVVAVVGLWMLYVRTQRYKYEKANRQLDPKTQWNTIYFYLAQYEMKFWFLRSFGIGLLHLMAVPNLSLMLDGTKQFSEENNAKRYEDSGIILATIFERTEERKEEAIRRMNYIHSFYKISNDEYLYQIYSFVLEHIRIMNMYGYRRLLRNEELAIMYFYIDLGEKMGVQNLATSIEEMEEFNYEFERIRVKYHPTNEKIISSFFKFLVSNTPSPMHSFMTSLMTTLLPDNIYNATRPIPPVPSALRSFIHYSLKAHALFVRYFCLPRSKPNLFTHDRPIHVSAIGPEENRWSKFYEYYNPYPNGYVMKNVGTHPGSLGDIHSCPFAHRI